jgi:hypothetical protein
MPRASAALSSGRFWKTGTESRCTQTIDAPPHSGQAAAAAARTLSSDRVA